ncbi:hypothetical protein L916_07465 [Phytophthora nicotianae]|uniref:Uncharacterized protein n=1 Tax=Phytophthora nicotianae TaxID=4792 RepID=W2J7K5_PHYNI|nr:hypothetical protein L916_07465 [Phytophthora nicotianae]
MYIEFRVNLSHAQTLKVLHGKPVRLTHAQLNAGHAHYCGPETYKKLVKAYESGKGTTLHMTHGEVLRTQQSGLDGSGFWGDLWDGTKEAGKSVWGFLKNNWKPIAGSVMDTVADLTGPETGGFIHEIRKGVKQLTGVGMAQPRRNRRIAASGSFRLS